MRFYLTFNQFEITRVKIMRNIKILALLSSLALSNSFYGNNKIESRILFYDGIRISRVYDKQEDRYSKWSSIIFNDLTGRPVPFPGRAGCINKSEALQVFPFTTLSSSASLDEFCSAINKFLKEEDSKIFCQNRATAEAFLKDAKNAQKIAQQINKKIFIWTGNPERGGIELVNLDGVQGPILGIGANDKWKFKKFEVKSKENFEEAMNEIFSDTYRAPVVCFKRKIAEELRVFIVCKLLNKE